MKRIMLFFTILTTVSMYSQVQENFSDGEFLSNPVWTGNTENFIVNTDMKLQLNLTLAGTSVLATPSEAMKNAQWEASFKINYNPSSSNYSCFYVCGQSPNLLQTSGYYVQIGNTADEISLYRQDSLTKVKIIDGLDGRVNSNPVDVRIKLSRDSVGKWMLYSKLANEVDFVLEGSVIDSSYKKSNYCGILCKNSASLGKAYIFDSIQISGSKYELQTLEPEIQYKKPNIGDIIINELLFNASDNTEEFVEVYNRLDTILDLSGLKITTRKTDGSLATGVSIPAKTLIEAKGYLAFCKTPQVDSLYYFAPVESRFTSQSLPALSNEGTKLVLCNASKDTIYDELSYSPSWHHPLIQNQQGVSLERIHPDLATQDAKSWHSASSEVHYATPGYRNSQYREVLALEKKKEFWIENENFTPNNDGLDDILLLHYSLEENGWMANISIFDAGGQKIKSLYKSQLLSTSGMLSWDGRTDDNRPANIGLYVIYIECFNTSIGKTKREKLVCVVSGR